MFLVTKQITIKLNEEKFRPLIDKLNEFSGTGLATSDSELVGRCIFYTYFSIFSKVHNQNTKSGFEVLQDCSGQDSSELIMTFLQEYSSFRKKGLSGSNR